MARLEGQGSARGDGEGRNGTGRRSESKVMMSDI